MDKEHAKIKRQLKEVCTVKDFESLLEQVMLSEEDKRILTLIYKEQKTLSYVADVLGMSESTIKKKHHKLLMKIGKIVSGMY